MTAALRAGDILLRQGNTVQDESADTVTVEGHVVQIEATQRLVVLSVRSTVTPSAGGRSRPSPRNGDIVVALLTARTRVTMPGHQGLEDIDPGQLLWVSGTLSWRTHTLLRPTQLVVRATPAVRPACHALPVAGDQDCPDAVRP